VDYFDGMSLILINPGDHANAPEAAPMDK